MLQMNKKFLITAKIQIKKLDRKNIIPEISSFQPVNKQSLEKSTHEMK